MRLVRTKFAQDAQPYDAAKIHMGKAFEKGEVAERCRRYFQECGKGLLLTIRRDRALQKEGKSFRYLDEMSLFINNLRQRLTDENLTIESPSLIPILKSKDVLFDGSLAVTCRPLSFYSKLEDKIILALTSRHLTRYFDKYLHDNILSYRPARRFRGKNHYVTDFNDGIRMIDDFRRAHRSSNIYAADCDIKKFYDTIPHDLVIECFEDLLKQSDLSEEGKNQVMNVVKAYLKSYNYFTNAWLATRKDNNLFYKVRRQLHDHDNVNAYRLKWINEIEALPVEQRKKIGVPQGGALSLLIANFVLNKIDSVFTGQQSGDSLFIRYCDDMILLHTDYDKCCQLMNEYALTLHKNGLYYHDFKNVSNRSRRNFWNIKSHSPFLWGDGEGNCNRYIGFLGYEIRRNGNIRLRKSNMNRFEDKFRRIKYVLRRYKEKHTEEEFVEQKNRVLENVLNGVNFYESLNFQQFLHGSQYRYLEKIKRRIDEDLSKEG